MAGSHSKSLFFMQLGTAGTSSVFQAWSAAGDVTDFPDLTSDENGIVYVLQFPSAFA